MLRACRRLLRPGGRTAFYTIHPAQGLTDGDHQRALDAAPRAADVPDTHENLLMTAGFSSIEGVDVTTDYRETLSAWIGQSDRFARQLRRLLGADAFDQRQAERRASLSAIDDGLLRRSLLVAARPA